MSLNRFISVKWLFGLSLLVLSVGVSPALAQTATAITPPVAFEYREDPVLQVASYYNAINVRDYARAYSYWESVPQNATLQQFTNGFADTISAEAYARLPVIADAGAGNLYAQVPTLLVASHTDGTEHYYAGCITVHKTNVPVGNATEPDPNWHLNSAALTEVDTFDLSLLNTACDVVSTFQEMPENLTSPVSLLESYFSAIVDRDYARAYGYWETPPSPTLAAFQQGFNTTQDVSAYLKLDVTIEGAAGSSYASLPAFVTAIQSNGSGQYFAGCYVTRKSNVPVGNATEPDPDWSFYGGNIASVASITRALAALETACSSVG